MNAPLKFSRPLGFSLPEVLTVITVVAILSAIAIVGYSGLRDRARESTAEDTVAVLNRALLQFNQANWDIVLDADATTTADELAVLHTLKWRNPVSSQATPGSPYIPATFCETVSSSDSDYRIQWNGHTFELLLPGTSGSGIKTGFDSGSGSTTYSFPSGYQPLGRNQHE